MHVWKQLVAYVVVGVEEEVLVVVVLVVVDEVVEEVVVVVVDEVLEEAVVFCHPSWQSGTNATNQTRQQPIRKKRGCQVTGLQATWEVTPTLVSEPR